MGLKFFNILALAGLGIPESEPAGKRNDNSAVRVGAVSLNYRDKLLVEGFYNPAYASP